MRRCLAHAAPAAAAISASSVLGRTECDGVTTERRRSPLPSTSMPYPAAAITKPRANEYSQSKGIVTPAVLDQLRREKMVVIDNVLSEQNIRDAIRRVKAHTMPGVDGTPADVYHELADEDKLVKHLRELYSQIQERGEMTASMRATVTTMLYKGKGDEHAPDRYRPICVTAVEYRILATAMAQRLVRLMPDILGESQIGFVVNRMISENIDLMEEVLRYCNHDVPERGGAAAILDNAHAYDRVAWPFLHQCLEAFALPWSTHSARARKRIDSGRCLPPTGTRAC